MIKRVTLLLYVMFLFESLQICKAQKITTKISIEEMPAFVKELQQNVPSVEMMYNNPTQYQQLLKRRQQLSLLLINKVKQHKLPESALQFLQPHQNINNNNINTTTFTDKVTAGNFHLVKDINQSKNSSPENRNDNRSGVLKNYAIINNLVYYAADDGIHGVELWRSNGTDTGTYMVKNIAAGNSSSYPNEITIFKNKIYFSTYIEGGGYELYQSDGTNTGTIRLTGKTKEAGNLTATTDQLYFTNYKDQLWKTDGTTEGTVLITDLEDGQAFDIQQMISLKGNVFFTAFSYSTGRELWYSNGSKAGTHMVKDINPDSNNLDYNGPENLTIYNGKLFFSALDGLSRTIWKTDGTLKGTKEVINNIMAVSPFSVEFENDHPFAIAKNEMYLAGYTASTGIDLYKYNFSTASTTLVKTISSSKTNVSFYNESIRSMNDSIYFLISNPAGTGYDLWKSDGTSSNTNIIKSFIGSADRNNFYSIGKKLYFSVHATESGNEPWISDGTSAGTKLLKDINTGISSSNPSEFTQCNGKIYFSAYSLAGGIELWKTDGTAINTKQVKNINTTSSASAVDYILKPLNANEIIFPASTPEAGTELWKSDGTEAGTVLVKDLRSGEAGIYPTFYESKNGKAYFTLYNDTSKSNDIYVTNGTDAGTKRIVKVTGSLGTLQVADNGIVFYTLYDYNTSNYLQLWRIDSTGNNFRLSLNINNVNGLGIGVAGNTCYFCDGATGNLWESNGAINGTKGLANNISGASFFVTVNNKIIFTANSFDKGSGLWISDGTINGTILLKNMSVNINSGTAILNNKLFFSGSEGIKGNELYKTDGTPAGTILVKDINPDGFSSSNPINFTTVGSSVHFTVTGINNQTELWKTSGTSTNTQLIKILSPRNLEAHDINNFTSAGGKLYFIDSTQLWVSDGTDTGTHVIIDPSNITSVYSLAAASNKIFFNGYSYNYGTELYVGDGSLNALKNVNNAVSKVLNKPSFSAQLKVNPFTDYISISINSPLKQKLQITSTNAAGQTLTAKAINVNTGYNLITLDAAKYLHGVYAITISSSSGSISLKAVK